jgi:type II secretory pathway component PulF
VARTDPDLLEGLADALAGSATEADALGALEQAGAPARALAQAIATAQRRGEPLLSAIALAARVSRADAALLEAVGREPPSHGAIVAGLRAVAGRQRALARRRAELTGALATPIAMVVLGIALGPLPNLVLGGPYFGPVLRDLGIATVVMVALLVGVPSLIGHRTIGPVLLEIVAALPFVGRLARAQLESEVATVLAPFADAGSVDPAGLRVAAAVATFGPLARALHPSRASLESLGEQASDALRLLLVTAPLAQRLDTRLARWSLDAAEASTRTQRRLLLVVAWMAVLATSVPMLARGLTGGLGVGAGGIPGGIPGLDLQNAEQRELEKIMNEPR